MPKSNSFYLDRLPRTASNHHTWLHFQTTLRPRPVTHGDLRVDGQFITPGSIVFSIPSKSKEAPTK